MASKFEIASDSIKESITLEQLLKMTADCDEYDRIVVDGLSGIVVSLGQNEVISFSYTECDLDVRLYEFRGQHIARLNRNLPDVKITSWSGEPITCIKFSENSGKRYIHLISHE